MSTKRKRLSIVDGKKKCLVCGVWLTVEDNFGKLGTFKSFDSYQISYKPDCKECHNKKKREQYAKGTTKFYHLWHTHFTRANKFGVENTLSKDDVEGILCESTYCFYCGIFLTDVQLDHKIPVSRGGPNTLENIVGCCGFCNRAKHNHSEEEYLNWLSYVRSNI